MKIIHRWFGRIRHQQAQDTATERKLGIRNTEGKFVTPADIERLEEEMVPWLRRRRRERR